MTFSQVTGLLGEPLDKETVEPFEVWYYHQTPQRTEGRITWRPKTGFVRFKKVPINGHEAFLLLDWKVPLWREVAAMPVGANETTTLIAPVVSNEPVKPDIANTEVNLSPPLPEPTPTPKPEPNPGISWQDMPAAAVKWFKSIPRIWLWIGGGVTAFIIFAIFKPDPRYRAPKKSPERKRRDD